MHQMMTARLHFERTRLTKLQNAYPLAMPERLYRPFTEKLVQMDTQLQNATSLYFMKQRNALERMQTHLRMQSPQQQVTYAKRQLDSITQQLTRSAFANIQQNRRQFDGVIRTLGALNPLAIMHKGFNVSYKDGKVVKSVDQLSPEDLVEVAFHDGTAKAKILEVEKKGNCDVTAIICSGDDRFGRGCP